MSSLLQPPVRETTGTPAPREPGERWLMDMPTLLLLAGAAVLLAALSWYNLAVWVRTYLQPDSYYAYGPVVPVLAGLMFWHRREALQAVPKGACFGALFVLIPALFVLILAEKRLMVTLASLGFLFAFWSSLWLVLGTLWMRAAAFPLGFIAWMSPLPAPILHNCTYSGQQLCTALANQTLHLLTFPTTLSGNLIAMEHFTLFVDVPCSGMKLLLTLLMFGAAFAYLVDGTPQRRLGMFFFTLPLAVFVNVARITILGVIGETFGAHAEHTIHDASGLMTVGLGLVILFYVARRIGCRTFAGWPLF